MTAIKSFTDLEQNWLKYLKERYTWKPSEEQMYWLRDAIDNSSSKPSKQNLESLYEQLKKLKEE